MYICEFCEIFKNTFLQNTSRRLFFCLLSVEALFIYFIKPFSRREDDANWRDMNKKSLLNNKKSPESL